MRSYPYAGGWQMTYYVFDPGLTTGYAVFNTKGTFLRKGQIEGIKEFSDALTAIVEEDSFAKNMEEDYEPIDRILFETFKIFPWVKQGGSEVPAAKVIAVIEYLADRYSIPCEGIDPKYKRIGYAWIGQKKPSNHAISHQYDAVALGEFWLRKNRIKPNEKP